LLSPKYSLAANLKKFDLLIVLSSTAGFEALRVGVPVFLLGKTFYSSYPGVVKVNSFEDLETKLKGFKPSPVALNSGALDQYIVKCFPGRFNYMNDDVVAQENVQKLLVPIELMLNRASE
jgi:capsule polysaccharide export protein KpsC/LpsZ